MTNIYQNPNGPDTSGVPDDVRAEIIRQDQQARMGALIETFNKWDAGYKKMVRALEDIALRDNHPAPCPDNKPGCLVLHYQQGELGKLAAYTLRDIGEWK